MLIAALENWRVETCDTLPTHRPLLVDIRITKLRRTLKTLRQCTDFAALNEATIQAKIDEARGQAIPEQEAAEDATAQPNVDEVAIRRAVVKSLHDETDAQIENRRMRLCEAVPHKDTDRLWQLITAALEEASIGFHKLDGQRSQQDERAIQGHVPIA